MRKKEKQKRVDEEQRSIEKIRIKEERKAEKEWKHQEIREARREENRRRAMEERRCFECGGFWPYGQSLQEQGSRGTNIGVLKQI